MYVEAEANKAAAKFDNASIDFQVEFYKKEGLTPYSTAKLPITSGKDVNVIFLIFPYYLCTIHPTSPPNLIMSLSF